MSVYSSSSSNNEHIRNLHQRTNNNNHALYPSSSDELSNSPSTYSSANYNPRPFDSKNVPNNFSRFASSKHLASKDSRRQTLSNEDESVLDLDDEDPRSSYASTMPYEQEADSYVDSFAIEEDEEPEHRMSMLGVKVRFHSKAPWEMGEGDIAEEDDFDQLSQHTTSRNKRGILAFGSGARRSEDSSRSGSGGKKSCETTTSQMSAKGTLQALAHASMSSSSLPYSPPPPNQPQPLPPSSLRQKLSLPRVRTRTTSESKSAQLASPSSQNSSSSPKSQVDFSQSHDRFDTRGDMCRSPSPVGHPYANPKLAQSSGDHAAHQRFPSQGSAIAHNSDSLATVMSTTPSQSSMDQYAAAMHTSPQIITRERANTKEISSPVSLHHNTQIRSNTTPEGKWRDTTAFPTLGSVWQETQQSGITLISLEEARAQRARTITMTSVDSNGSFLPGETRPASPAPSSIFRSRLRSTSTGAKVKDDYGKAEPTTPESHAKGLKHKKSGFMRMFGAKEKDRSPAPPSPAFSTFAEAIPPVPRTPKISTQRVPVPPLSPDGDFEGRRSRRSTDSHEEATISGHSHMTDFATKVPPRKSSLVPPKASGAASPRSLAQFAPPEAPFASSFGEQPQSAPPATTDFVGLKLRPVSTIFSSQFGDHIFDSEPSMVAHGSIPSLDVDSGTPSSTSHSGSEGMSPISPDFSLNAFPRSGSNADHSHSDSRSALDQGYVSKQASQRQFLELEAQVRDLKAEIEDLRSLDAGNYCETCGRGSHRQDASRRPRKEVSQQRYG